MATTAVVNTTAGITAEDAIIDNHIVSIYDNVASTIPEYGIVYR